MGQAGEERTRRYDELFRAHGRSVVSYCSWRSHPSGDAQDAAAEVFLIAWRRLDEVPAGDAARVWLYATARRVVANQRRSGRRRSALREELARQPAPPPEPAPFASDPAGDRVRDALRRLDPVDREVLLLSEWESLAPAEIARVLGCLAVTARGRLHRARRRFRAAYEALAPVGGDDEPHAALPREAVDRPASGVQEGVPT